jgi:hypothetical protein
MLHCMRRYLLVTPALNNRAQAVQWRRLYARIMLYLDNLKFAEQRRRKAFFGKRRQDDDVLSVHPRTLAELKRRGYGSLG